MSDGTRTEVRALARFDRIALNAYGEMTVERGDECSITIEADGDVIEKIKTEVVGGVLRVSVVGSWFTRVKTAAKAGLTSRKIRYLVKVDRLSHVEISDAAKLFAEDLETESLTMLVDGAGYVRIGRLAAKTLKVDLPGASSVEIAGEVDEQRVDLGGLGRYEASRLGCRRAVVELKGAGKAAVAATEELDVTIRGLGHVSYLGDPRVNKDISGLGKIERVGPIPL